MDKDRIITISIVVAVLIIGLFGLDKHEATIASYSTEFNTYVLAEYSEMDFEGYTDSWEEQVSASWDVLTVMDTVIKYNCPVNLITGYTCKSPKITIAHPKNSSFNNYRTVRSITYYVDYGDGDYSTVKKEAYNVAREKIGKIVTVKTWYGNAYGFEY